MALLVGIWHTAFLAIMFPWKIMTSATEEMTKPIEKIPGDKEGDESSAGFVEINEDEKYDQSTRHQFECRPSCSSNSKVISFILILYVDDLLTRFKKWAFLLLQEGT